MVWWEFEKGRGDQSLIASFGHRDEPGHPWDSLGTRVGGIGEGKVALVYPPAETAGQKRRPGVRAGDVVATPLVK